MKVMDFLSGPPNIFIFGKKRNKTKFGGILFLIYILLMALISLVYILNYVMNDKFSYESYIFYNNTDERNEDRDDLEEDEQLNPFANITLSVKNGEFLIFDEKKKGYVQEDNRDKEGHYIYNMKRRVKDIRLTIYYRCGMIKGNCSSIKNIVDYYYDYCGYINISFNLPDYPIDHSKRLPVDENNPKPFTKSFNMNYDVKMKEVKYDWEIIRYSDQKSLFDLLTRQKREYIFGHIKNEDLTETTFKIDDIKEINKESKHSNDYGALFPFIRIKFNIDFNKYLYYKRKTLSILDVLSSIGALFTTINFFFSVAFSFYIQNFNNYKIVGNILNRSKELNKEIEIKNNGNLNEIIFSKKKIRTAK